MVFSIVIPAKAGIQYLYFLETCALSLIACYDIIFTIFAIEDECFPSVYGCSAS